MKIAIIGAGAMGNLFGGYLAQAGEEVTLVDVWREGVEAVNQHGLRIDDKSGESKVVKVKATTQQSEVGLVDMAMVFVKCYHTETAVRDAMPMFGPRTVVLTLQNGWGNAPRIADMVGPDRVVVGLTYHSATVAGPGHIQHTGRGMTVLGELNGQATERLNQIGEIIKKTGFDVSLSNDILKEIWSKLALNCCTLPTSALLRFTANQLVEHEGSLDLMRGILREVVAVANAQGIALSYNERWETITNLLKKAVGGRSSMLQDVEKSRRTEIEVINQAIVDAGCKLHIPTPYNEAMVCLVRSLQENFNSGT